MMRHSRVVTISLPLALLARVLKTAKVKGMTRSELVRETLRRYEREEQEWQALLAYGRRKAQAASIRTEADVERLVEECRILLVEAGYLSTPRLTRQLATARARFRKGRAIPWELLKRELK